MSERSIRNCDGCGEEIGTIETTRAHRLAVQVDRRPSGAGDSDNWYMQVDLCTKCALTELRKRVSDMNWQDAKAWAMAAGSDGVER